MQIFLEKLIRICLTEDLSIFSPVNILISAALPGISAGFRDARRFIAIIPEFMNAISMGE